MNDANGYSYSFAGFVDYTTCFTVKFSVWSAIGLIITVGTMVSCIPQIFKIIKNRTSYGLSSVYVCTTLSGSLILFSNYLYLHTADFIGISQLSFGTTMPRMLSFVNIFTLYMFTMPTMFNTLVFFHRPKETSYKIAALSIAIVIVCDIISGSLYVGLSQGGGTSGMPLKIAGKVYGIIAAGLTLFQYFPQIITTIRVKSSGSLSLILLGLQGPGGLVNSLFLAIGNNDDWTTWVSLMLAAIQQLILLALCIFFEVRKKIQAKKAINSQPLLEDKSFDNSAVN